MKNRYLSIFLFLAFGLFALSGCEDVAQVQTPIDFAQLRVANFNNTCNMEMQQVYDVYIYPVGQPSSIPQVRGGLSYGIVTPWIDNLQTNRDAGLTYKVQVRTAGETQNRNIIDKEITLKPGDRYTLWIFKSDDPSTMNAEFISDKPDFTVEQTKAYFRFINTQEDAGKLTLRVSDPLNGNPIAGTTDVEFKKYTKYEGFTSTTIDTTLTFFVVDQNSNVVGRIAGVALEGGTYKTITWGGNCPGRYVPQEDATVARPDSHHVRILDDAGDGADETKIVPQTLRYFFVNALIPPTYNDVPSLVDYDQLGVVVNNDNRYNFAPLAPYSVGPNGSITGDGVINVVPTATLLTDAVNVKGYVYNPSAPSVRGPLLFDYRAGPRENMVTDQLVAFVLSDTVRKHTPGTKHPIDSTKGQFVVKIPDQPLKDQATFVLLNMLAPPSKPPATTNKAEFFINDVKVEHAGNWNIKIDEIATAPGNTQVKIHARVNATDDELVPARTFQAQSGGIYLVVLVGRRVSPTAQDMPQLMIIRTNP